MDVQDCVHSCKQVCLDDRATKCANVCYRGGLWVVSAILSLGSGAIGGFVIRLLLER